jgi:hypothetical protein
MKKSVFRVGTGAVAALALAVSVLALAGCDAISLVDKVKDEVDKALDVQPEELKEPVTVKLKVTLPKGEMPSTVILLKEPCTQKMTVKQLGKIDQKSVLGYVNFDANEDDEGTIEIKGINYSHGGIMIVTSKMPDMENIDLENFNPEDLKIITKIYSSKEYIAFSDDAPIDVDTAKLEVIGSEEIPMQLE